MGGHSGLGLERRARVFWIRVRKGGGQHEPGPGGDGMGHARWTADLPWWSTGERAPGSGSRWGRRPGVSPGTMGDKHIAHVTAAPRHPRQTPFRGHHPPPWGPLLVPKPSETQTSRQLLLTGWNWRHKVKPIHPSWCKGQGALRDENDTDRMSSSPIPSSLSPDPRQSPACHPQSHPCPPPALPCIPGTSVSRVSLPLNFRQVQPMGGTCPRWEGRGKGEARVCPPLCFARWHFWQVLSWT